MPELLNELQVLKIVALQSSHRYRVRFTYPRMRYEVYQDVNATDELGAYIELKKYIQNLTMLDQGDLNVCRPRA